MERSRFDANWFSFFYVFVNFSFSILSEVIMYIKLLAFPLKENVYLVTENQTVWKIKMREKRKTK